MKKLRTLLIFLVLISTLFTNIPFVKADGSLDPEEFTAHAKAIIGNPTVETSDDNLEGRIHADLFTTPVCLGLVIESMSAYIKFTTTATSHVKMAIYEHINDTNAGALLYQSEEHTEGATTANKWITCDFTNPPTLEGNTKYFFAVWSDSVNGEILLVCASTGGYSLEDVRPYNGWPAQFAEDYINGYELSMHVSGYAIKTTSVNAYYGSVNDYVAVRNFSYSFPSGSSEKEYNVYFPRKEKFVNLTVGDILITSGYSISDYNSTHSKLTVSDSVIEDEMTLYTETYDYQYTLKGLYYENGTKDGSVEVTAYSEASSDDYTVDGILIIGSNSPIIQFAWNLAGGGTRRVYSIDSPETIYLFTPDDDYASYSFTIRDYTGSVGSGDTFLEALRVVNGTERIVERMLIWDTVNTVPLTLTKDKIYILQVRFPDNSTYRFGYFIPSSDPTPILTISGMAFSNQAHYVGEHITVEATRPNATHIQINYEDTLEQTNEVFVEICYLNGTQVWNDTAVSSDVVFNWFNAINTTDYLVNLIAEHEFYEEVTYTKFLEGEEIPLDYLDWDELLGEGATLGISLLLIFMGFGIFSTYTAEIGCFSGLTITYILNYANFLPIKIPWVILHSAMGLLIMWFLSGGRK